MAKDLKCKIFNLLNCYSWKDGQKYIGEYTEGDKKGKGKFVYPDGSTYEGDVKDNNLHGEG